MYPSPMDGTEQIVWSVSHTEPAFQNTVMPHQKFGVEGEFACCKHVPISNGLHLVDTILVHQPVKGIVQVGQHEEDLNCRHGGCHGAEAHDVTEQDDHVLVGVPNHLVPILKASICMSSRVCFLIDDMVALQGCSPW